MNRNVKVTECFHRCDFYSGIPVEPMPCTRPYWDDKNPYENAIITHENSRNSRIPEMCPLRHEDLTITYFADNNNK